MAKQTKKPPTVLSSGSQEHYLCSFIPDWEEIWTPEEAADQIGFAFEGVGWYTDDYVGADGEMHADTMLVLPAGDQEDGSVRYRFCVYSSSSSVHEIFQRIASMPVRRSNEREKR